jgi:hypothetical protein
MSPLFAVINLNHNFPHYFDHTLLLFINPATIHTRIKIPLTTKRSIALFFRSPNKKKLGASDDTKYKYPPKASKVKAESKINFLKTPISTNQLKACKNFCRSNNKIVNFN